MKYNVVIGNAAWYTKMLMFFSLSIMAHTLSAFETINSTSIPIEVSIDDRKKFEDISCMRLVGTEIEKIQALTTKGRHSPTEVFIECKPHNSLEGYPLRVSVNCNPTKGKWSCEHPALQVLTILSGQKIIVSSEPKEIYGAIDAIVFLDKSGKFKDNNSINGSSKENVCSTYEFKNSKWSVQCNGSWRADLQQLCEKDKCNFELLNEGPILH